MKLHRNFYLLLSGQSLANIGDVLYMVSVISIIYALTGSATASSFVPFTITTSMFISSLLTPLLIGKINLKWLMAGSQIGKTIFLFILGLVMVETTAANYYLLFLFITFIAFLDGCANPIRQALIPHYVNPEHLIQANGIAETVTQLIQTVMWFVGSLFLILLSPEQLIWIVGSLFTMASILLCFIESVSHKPTKQQGRFELIKEGWRTLYHTQVLRKIAWINLFETIAGTVWIAAIIYSFISDALHVGEQWWGFINGTYCFGLILGSICCIRYSGYIENKLGSFIFAASLAGFIATIGFGVNSIPIIALLFSLAVGFFEQIKNIPLQTVVQTSVTKEQLSTVYTSLGAIGTGVFGIGSLIMGILADLLGIRIVFFISGILLATVSIIVFRNKSLFVKHMVEIK